MPQLDQFTYLTQFFWLCIFYMTFYILLFNAGLPKISRILKLRAHMVSQQKPQSTSEHITTSDSISVEKVAEKGEAKSSNQDVVFRALNNSISYLYSSVNGASSWCTKSVDTLNINQLKPINKSYLRSLGEINLSHLIKYNALEASAPVTFSSRPSMYLKTSHVWALRVQKCLLSSINKKKKKK